MAGQKICNGDRSLIVAMATCLMTFLAISGAEGQSNIDSVHKHAWSENVGWLNWRDADGTTAGVLVSETFLSGFIWAENIGWINTGDGTPGGGDSYTNSDGTDFGVNIDIDGNLTGFAWGENIGWVNFDTSTVGANRAVFDSTAGRFRGYAWGENIGWINLDDATRFISVANPFVRGDANLDDALDIADALFVLGYLFQAGPADCLLALDYNDDETISISDATGVLCFLFCSGASPPPPSEPYPDCGLDPTPGALSCAVIVTGCP